jgi:hypothetical protein
MDAKTNPGYHRVFAVGLKYEYSLARIDIQRCMAGSNWNEGMN